MQSRLRNRCIVLAVCAGAGLLSTSLLGLAPGSKIRVRACFDDVGGLESGDPVFVSGIEVGYVKRVGMAGDFRACADLAIDASLGLPEDSSAAIETANILGHRLIALEPGGSDERLADRGEIHFTQNAMSIEDVVGRVIMELGSPRGR